MQQVVFLSVAKDDVDSLDFPDLFGGILGETTYHCDYGVGVCRQSLSYGVATFLFGDGCYGAGVDNVEVGLVAVVHLFPSGRCECADDM